MIICVVSVVMAYMTENVKQNETGYKRKHNKVCDRCRNSDLIYNSKGLKGWVKCGHCGKLFYKNHKFNRVIE